MGWVGVCLPVYIGWSGNASLVRGRLSGDLTQNIPCPLADRALWTPWPGSDLSPPLSASPLLQAHWPSCCSSNLPSSFLPQNLFAFRSFCPETSSSRSSHGSRPHFIQVSAQCPLLGEALPNHPAFSRALHPLPCPGFLPSVYFNMTFFSIYLFCLSDMQAP